MPPIDTNYQVKQGESTEAYNSRIANYNATKTPISMSGIQNPEQPFNVPTPPGQTDHQPTIDNSLESLLAAFNAPTATEQEGADIQGDLLSSIAKLGTKGKRQAELEAQAGLPDQRKNLQDVINQLQGLQKESMAIPLQIQQQAQGKGVTAAGVAPIEAGRLRENTIKALGLAAIGQTFQNNIALAESSIDKALDVEFEPEETRYKMLEKFYEFNQDAITREESRRSTTLTTFLNERSRILGEAKADLDRKRADKKEIFDIGLIAQRNNADTATVQKIFEAKTREDAVALAGNFMVDPKAKHELEGARLSNLLTQAQINRTLKETSLLGQVSASDRKAAEQALKTANESIPVMQDKISIANALKNHSGMKGTVGPYKISRFTPFSPDKAKRVEFIGSVENLLSGLTLDNLIAAKARGATFGALSEGELGILAKSASSINQWALKDDKGKVYGYEVGETQFKGALDEIIRLTERALIKSTGQIFDEDESAVLSDAFGTTSQTSSPASFYGL